MGIIKSDVQFYIPAFGIRVDVVITYDTKDPLAVKFDIDCPCGCNESIPWYVSRDMLFTSLNEKVGLGEVKMFPVKESNFIAFEIVNEEGTSLSYMYADDIKRFLRRTYKLVAMGSEHRFIDFDRLLPA